MGFRFTPVQSKCIFRQLLEALKYLHEHKYVHRDLKSSNILITDRFCVKLADFGLARSISSPIFSNSRDCESTNEFTNKVVTLWYRPPELLLGSTRYDEKVDIWSSGCILAELLLGKAIFPGKDLSCFLSFGHGNMTVPALGLVERMLEHNPKKRLRAERALESQYFLSHPIAPDRPEKLGYINLKRDSHEFQTKPIRREAKNYAQQASQRAKENGKDEKSSYELAYMEYLRNAAVNDNAIVSFNSYTNKSNNINKVGGWSRSPKFQESQIKRKRVR